jgi:hypothetical protein
VNGVSIRPTLGCRVGEHVGIGGAEATVRGGRAVTSSVARASTTSDVFNAIAKGQRRQILDALLTGEMPVGALVTELSRELDVCEIDLRVGGSYHFREEDGFTTMTDRLAFRDRATRDSTVWAAADGVHAAEGGQAAWDRLDDHLASLA